MISWPVLLRVKITESINAFLAGSCSVWGAMQKPRCRKQIEVRKWLQGSRKWDRTHHYKRVASTHQRWIWKSGLIWPNKWFRKNTKHIVGYIAYRLWGEYCCNRVNDEIIETQIRSNNEHGNRRQMGRREKTVHSVIQNLDHIQQRLFTDSEWIWERGKD